MNKNVEKRKAIGKQPLETYNFAPGRSCRQFLAKIIGGKNELRCAL